MTPLLVIALMVAGCGSGPATPEAEIRLWLADAESEAEDRNRRAFMSRVAEGYADARGNRRSDIDKIFRYLLLRQKAVALLTNIEAISVYDESAAEIVMTVGMARTSGGLNLSAEAWQFELELEKSDGVWMLIGARWGQLGGELR